MQPGIARYKLPPRYHVGCVRLAAMVLTVWVGGCRIEGDWQAVRFEPTPTERTTVVSAVSFGENGQYTATLVRGAERATMNGQYEWNGSQLHLSPKGGDPAVYACRVGTGGEMTLHDSTARPPYTATLRRSR